MAKRKDVKTEVPMTPVDMTPGIHDLPKKTPINVE